MGWMDSDLLISVYYPGALGDRFSPMPGVGLEAALAASALEPEVKRYCLGRLSVSCRKLCFMWEAGERARAQETDFMMGEERDSPCLFGENAVKVRYDLEALILFARSAMDIASGVFAQTHPDPFPRRQMDSLNDLAKVILREETRSPAADYFRLQSDDSHGWLSILSGTRGRSMRDKLAHQTEFPIQYEELDAHSSRESAVVVLDNTTAIPLPDFIDRVRLGVVDAFLQLEQVSVEFLGGLRTVPDGPSDAAPAS